ncbi:MAG TPA: ATP-binding protein [Thermoanaerobaculia bacterium]|jgi:predicted HTH transcriptional regulator|nr:MAG: Divergent AAA domain protein [Synergistetes bacterium ADurb.BinA166]HRS37185.1 ATP-binding protein [Thermoanaerobaculia bacterium]HRU10191.1 ATP-binding protein [Thermoanaerobaculia bacterium]
MGVPFSAKELRRILQRDEGKFLEFKSLRERDPAHQPRRPIYRRTVRDWIAEYAAAFSDADGGTHFLGVEDDCSPTGINYPRERGIQRKLGTLSTV